MRQGNAYTRARHHRLSHRQALVDQTGRFLGTDLRALTAGGAGPLINNEKVKAGIILNGFLRAGIHTRMLAALLT